MLLGFHCWVYCQLRVREHGWSGRDTAFDEVLANFTPMCREIAGAGFDALETMVDLLLKPGGFDVHAAGLEASDLQYLGVSHNAAFWDPAQRNELVELLDRVCAQAARLGGQHLGMSAVPVPGRAKTEADYDAQAETFRAVSNAVRRHGVMPNLHTYERDAAEDCREVQEMVDRLAPEEFTLGLDLAWLAKGGADPVQVTKRFGRRLGFLHVRDRTSGNEWAEAAGEGIDDFAALGEALREVGFDGPVVFEPAFADWAPTRPLAETLAMSAKHLRRTLHLE